MFKNIQAGASAVAYISKYFALFMNVAMPLILLLISFIARKKEKNKLKKAERVYGYCCLINKAGYKQTGKKILKTLQTKNELNLLKKEGK